MNTSRKPLERISGIPERVRARIAEQMAKHPSVEKVILYGSRARGDAVRTSDIDLCIVGDDLSREEWVDLSLWLREDLDTLLQVDVVRWDQAPDPLRRRVERDGNVVYERS